MVWPFREAAFRITGMMQKGYRFGEILDGRYEVIAAHGKGVFSTVVRAKDLKAGSSDPEEVAIKIIRNNDKIFKVLELGMNFRTADDINATLVVKLTRRLGFGMWAKLHLTGMHLEGKLNLDGHILRQKLHDLQYCMHRVVTWQKLDLSKANFLDMPRILQVEMRAPCTCILKALYLRRILWVERCP